MRGVRGEEILLIYYLLLTIYSRLIGIFDESGSSLRCEEVPFDRLRTGYVSLLAPKGQANIGVL